MREHTHGHSPRAQPHENAWIYTTASQLRFLGSGSVQCLGSATDLGRNCYSMCLSAMAYSWASNAQDSGVSFIYRWEILSETAGEEEAVYILFSEAVYILFSLLSCEFFFILFLQ